MRVEAQVAILVDEKLGKKEISSRQRRTFGSLVLEVDCCFILEKVVCIQVMWEAHSKSGNLLSKVKATLPATKVA